MISVSLVHRRNLSALPSSPNVYENSLRRRNAHHRRRRQNWQPDHRVRHHFPREAIPTREDADQGCSPVETPPAQLINRFLYINICLHATIYFQSKTNGFAMSALRKISLPLLWKRLVLIWSAWWYLTHPVYHLPRDTCAQNLACNTELYKKQSKTAQWSSWQTPEIRSEHYCSKNTLWGAARNRPYIYNTKNSGEPKYGIVFNKMIVYISAQFTPLI